MMTSRMQALVLLATTHMVALTSIEKSAAAQSVVTIREMNQRLELTGAKSAWPVAGDILPPFLARPGGESLIFVRKNDGGVEAQRHDRQGRQLAAAAVAAGGTVRAARVFGTALVVATDGALQVLDAASLKVRQQRALGKPFGPGQVIAGPHGVWSVGNDELAYVDLNGSAWSKKLPLAAWEQPPCPAPGTCIEKNVLRSADTTESGDLLIIETVDERHPIKGIGASDVVNLSRAVWVDVKGALLSSSWLSRAETYGEWFWSQNTSGNPSGVPSRWGIRRTRYRSSDPVSSVLQGRAAGVVVARQEKHFVTTLEAMNRDGRSAWQRRLNLRAVGAVSPPWTAQTLIHDPECTHLAVVSPEGSLVAETDRVLIPEVIEELEKTSNRSPTLAIGQAADGAWLLYAFGPATAPR